MQISASAETADFVAATFYELILFSEKSYLIAYAIHMSLCNTYFRATHMLVFGIVVPVKEERRIFLHRTKNKTNASL